MITNHLLQKLYGLNGKVALITGGGAGIGKACARLFSQAGATVIVADKDMDAAHAVAESLGEAGFALEFDLEHDETIEAAFSTLDTRFDRLDVLVNNAGIYPKYAFDSLTQAQWQNMQHVNVWGCFQVMRAASVRMRQYGHGGRIVNISSVGAQRPAVIHQVAYNASKAALDSMTASAALELAPHGILVNSILPGAVRPLDPKPPAAGHIPATGPLMGPGRIVLGRAADPDEVAAPILMLASAAGGYITGQCIVIDGGFSIS